MRRVLFLFLAFYVSKAAGQNKSYDYCYRTGPASFRLYSVADKKDYPILKSKRHISDASLSPDGKKVAYCFYPSRNARKLIAIIDLNTKRKIVLNTHGTDCEEPEWSPDGKLIAYNIWNEKLKKRDIAVIDADNKWFKILTRRMPEIWGVSWTSDSKKIIASDLDSVFFIDLNGEITNIYKTSDIAKNRWCRDFRLTTDGKKLVFLYHVDEIVNSTGGSSAVFVYDMITKKKFRISPKGYHFTNVIIYHNTVLASGEKASGVPNSGVYAIDLDGKNFRLFLPNASDITVKN
ncbi:MAG: PD40 domain-containing protein [Bacteroidetes bacterium]|jgi:Tol biopolymer transport system component|nr:PD40 domain-containing protein [Bacteroidota bacterium]